MTDKNTMGKIAYILTNIYWAFVLMVLYRYFVFIPIDGMTVGKSKTILWILLFVCITLGVYITYRKRRNCLSVIVNILFPYELHAMILYFTYCRSRVLAVACVALLLSAVFFVLIVFRRIQAIRNKPRIIRHRLYYALMGSRTIVTVILCAFVLSIGVNSIIGRDLYKSNVESPTSVQELDKWTISNNIETILKLKPEVWNELSIEDRLEVLGVIKNIESRYLGIHHEIYLAASSLDEGTLACYQPQEHKIIIDIRHLQNGDVTEVVSSLCHECHHAYTRQQVELYQLVPDEYKNMMMFHTVQEYEKEYANYVSGNDDFAEYSTQWVEIMANSYGDDAAEDYFEAISTYESQGGE